MVEIVDEEQQFVEDLIRENKITDQKIFENEALERFENRLPCGLHVSHGHIIGVSCYYDFPDSIKKPPAFAKIRDLSESWWFHYSF